MDCYKIPEDVENTRAYPRRKMIYYKVKTIPKVSWLNLCKFHSDIRDNNVDCWSFLWWTTTLKVAFTVQLWSNARETSRVLLLCFNSWVCKVAFLNKETSFINYENMSAATNAIGIDWCKFIKETLTTNKCKLFFLWL
jgi:hypothetical protein